MKSTRKEKYNNQTTEYNKHTLEYPVSYCTAINKLIIKYNILWQVALEYW